MLVFEKVRQEVIMTSTEHIERLLQEIGPALDVEAVNRYEDNLWAIIYDDNTIIEVDLDSGQGKLTFSIDLGKPEEDKRLSTYETLLTYTYLWKDTGGIKMALDGPNGHAVQIFDLNATDLDLDTMRTVLGNFVETARFWRKVISQGGVVSDGETGRVKDDRKDLTGAIRV